MDILKSTQDASVNFILPHQQEARYVRRDPDKVLVYLSSHSGCARACRFCHLTQTGQTNERPTKWYEYLDQAQAVLDYYTSRRPTEGIAKSVNFNFMARGEPLLNPCLATYPSKLFVKLYDLAYAAGFKRIKFNVSTIMPAGVTLSPTASAGFTMQLFYSLYSVNPAFRKRWLPKAMPVEQALAQLQAWLDADEENFLTFHHAFIAGENDSEADVEALARTLEPFKGRAKFNLVRYNPYSPAQGVESDPETLQMRFNRLAQALPHPRTRIVPRVGTDVAASCGTFINLGINGN